MQELDRFEDSKDPANSVINVRWSEPGDDESNKYLQSLSKNLNCVDWGIIDKNYGFRFPKIASKMFNHINNFKMIRRVSRLEIEVKLALYISQHVKDTLMCMIKLFSHYVLRHTTLIDSGTLELS